MNRPRILDDWAAFLKGKAHDVTSQNGEDGLIAALLERIGVVHRWCFEVGAHDGTHLSNTLSLRRQGWNAVLIEADHSLYSELAWQFGWQSKCIHAKVTAKPANLDAILASANPSGMFDLGVIDIDGADVAVWEGMKLRPRVMLVEFNPSGDGIQGGCTQWQAGEATLMKAAIAKGYRPLAATLCNMLMIDEAAMPS